MPELMDDNSRFAQVESYVDGEMSAAEAEQFEAACAVDQTLADQVELALKIESGLHEMHAPPCPDEVVAGIFSEVRRDLRATFWTRFKKALLSGLKPRLQPALAMAVLLTLVISSALIVRSPRQQPEQQVTQALQEVKWTLAYLSDVGRQTGESMRSDIIEPHVLTPIGRSVNVIMEK